MNGKTLLILAVAALAAPSISAAMPNMTPPAESATQDKFAGKPPISGKALEVIHSGGYTYLFIEDSDGFKDWVAIPETQIEVGAMVELAPGYSMGEWKSKTLDRTFKAITFSGGPTDKFNEQRKMSAHKGVNMNEPAPGNKKTEGKVIEGLKVDKAKGENAYDLDEIFAKRDALQDKVILVRGQVVKVTERVMDRNWIHLKDGTNGGANKLVVTSKDDASVGEIITVKGAFHNNVDFGGGYQYAVIVEDAVIVK